MAKLTMARSADFKPRQKKMASEEIAQVAENRKVNTGYSREWSRQKLRISDFYPDEQFIKENSAHEFKYIILITLPVITMSLFVFVHKNDLYNEFLVFLEKFLSALW